MAHVPVFFFNDPATTEIYTLSLHDALPIFLRRTSKMSHAAQIATEFRSPEKRPNYPESRRWLWRLVRPCTSFRKNPKLPQPFSSHAASPQVVFYFRHLFALAMHAR